MDDDDVVDVCVTCGYVDSWCELCGFHGHSCPRDGEEQKKWMTTEEES